MFYRLTRGLVLRLMKAPTRPPDPPAGSHDSIQVYRASPRYLTYRLLLVWIATFVLVVAWSILFVVALGERGPPLLLPILIAPVLLCGLFCAYFAIRIDYDMRYYIVTDRSMRVREGALIVKEQTITYANVQNLRVVQGPLLQLFRIWNLKVDTAGGGGAGAEGEHGSGHNIQMAGIANAHEVRDLILSHLRRHGGGAGLGDLDDTSRRAAAPSKELLGVLRELSTAAAGLRQAAEG